MTKLSAKLKTQFKVWTGREWNTWPVFPLLLIGLVISLIFSGSTSDWTVAQAWAMSSGFVICGTVLLYWVQAPLKAPIYRTKKRRAYLFGMWSAFSLRWLLLGVPLFVAALNPQYFSVATAAACALLTPILLVGSSLALYLIQAARREKDVAKQHGTT